MKDFLKLFKTIMDLKDLTFLVLKQLTIKRLRLVFFWAMVNQPNRPTTQPAYQPKSEKRA